MVYGFPLLFQKQYLPFLRDSFITQPQSQENLLEQLDNLMVGIKLILEQEGKGMVDSDMLSVTATHSQIAVFFVLAIWML